MLKLRVICSRIGDGSADRAATFLTQRLSGGAFAAGRRVGVAVILPLTVLEPVQLPYSWVPLVLSHWPQEGWHLRDDAPARPVHHFKEVLLQREARRNPCHLRPT